MGDEKSQNYWIFSNKPERAYGNSDWDMSSILKTNHYYLLEEENNRSHIKQGDFVYMRIYGECFLGNFTVGGNWAFDPKSEDKHNCKAGYFPIGDDLLIWKRPLPQNLILRDLSNQNIRARISYITYEDTIKIETAQLIYEKLGFGGADGEIFILEKGLEEAIKPNLENYGLKLAVEKIQQQFSMGPGVGRSDLICSDKDGNLIVIELKRGLSSDEAVGQILRYIGWIRENVASEDQNVHGWIITGDYDEQLRLAASAANVRLLRVRIN